MASSSGLGVSLLPAVRIGKGALVGAGTDALVFTEVPNGCLYWLTPIDSDQEERIFTSDGGTQVWW